MAPRTRHEYARERAANHNSRGFSAFPTELLHHIGSHIEGTTSIPWYQDCPSDGQRNKRRDVLRTLCQVCRSWRTALLPLVWNSLEAYTLLPPPSNGGYGTFTARAKGVGKELLAQLRLARDVKQPYASHVRIITVAIYSVDVLTKLARAMTLMPNLHTFHMMCGPYHGHGIGFQGAFSGLVFPSVRRVILPATAQDIFGSFPEAVEVLTNHPHYFHFASFLDNMTSHCPKVESIGWREDPEPEVELERNSCLVAEKLPNLRRITYYTINYDVFDIVQLMPLNLEKITLVGRESNDSEEVAEVVEAAQQVLAGSSLPNKCLEVISGDGKRTIAIPDKARVKDRFTSVSY